MNHVHNPLGPLQHSEAFDLAFRLARQPAAPKACLVLLHGVGGAETNLAELASGVAPDTLVVLPRGPLEFAPGQFGWFRVAFTGNGPRIDAGEAEASRLALIRFVAQLQAAYSVAPEKTFIAGFSQGGILSASVALSAPEQVGGFAILSGRILPELEPHLADKPRLQKLSAFIGHGEYDSKLPVQWAQGADRWLQELEVPHQTRLYPIDHGISSAMQADFVQWVNGQIQG